MGGNQELQSYLQRMVGYTLIGSTQEHALFFLYGTGADGKPVSVNMLTTILRGYVTSASMGTFMKTCADRYPTDMVGLHGAHFTAAIGAEQSKHWAESKLKDLTGNDKISARFTRQGLFEFFPRFKLLVADNHKPAIRNIDEAMERRLYLIPLMITVLPGRRDKNLQQKLLAERDGILAWAVQGCLDWQRHERLSPLQRVVDATEEYFEAKDTLGRWFDERCMREPDAKSLTVELFNDWKQWAETSGEFVGAQRCFPGLPITRGLDKWRNRIGVCEFQGIGFKHPPTPAHAPCADS